MKPEQLSNRLLGITRSKAKMYEYNVPSQYHIDIPRDPSRLFPLAIGLLGDFASRINTISTDTTTLTAMRNEMRFSAYFFDAYFESKLKNDVDVYLLLIGSVAYYLGDLPGSSKVLAGKVEGYDYDLGGLGFEKMLLWLVKGNFSIRIENYAGVYAQILNELSEDLSTYFKNGEGLDIISGRLKKLVDYAYANGTPRQLFFADLICALTKKRLMNSTWYCLPRYSGISVQSWQSTIQKETFITEFWPAQHLLGEHGVYRGISSIVQMPTSAGKTRATEIIIRSAFLSGRTTLTIVVAPFKALCHEIQTNLAIAFHNEPVSVDELSDVLQTDYKLDQLLKTNQILVVTPEKLLYVLRHSPEFGKAIGLLIYDEGHQFDNGIRGVTYELLLTSLKSMVPDNIQTILISAVISNAEAVNNWLNSGDSQVIAGKDISPTYRTVAFASWGDQLGRLEFVANTDPELREFFVPRVIEQQELQITGRERKKRFFPEKSDARSVALYLGLKLVSNGSVAIFCGKKSTASGFCEQIVEAYDRGLDIPKPFAFSNPDEVERLCYLHECNLGVDSSVTKTARIGIFMHHGNTPHGIRLAVEHAMKEELIKFVVCTSTLAQGVNLPIRYLIVASVYQGRESIKVRDFHNLIGRAGRSGMHTEGSIIFADPEIYDKRNDRQERYKWLKVKEMLDPTNSEPCASTLMSIFEPLVSDDKKYSIRVDTLNIAQMYVDEPSKLNDLPGKIYSEHGDKGFSTFGLEMQIKGKLSILGAIESYLMANWDDSGLSIPEDNAEVLARGTFAYHLSNEEDRNRIIELFKLLAKNIENNVGDAARRKVFGATLYGVWDSLLVERWVKDNLDAIAMSETHDELMDVLWPVVTQRIRNASFRKCNSPENLQELAHKWIQGESFQAILAILIEADCKFGLGKRQRDPQIDHVVDICENALSYDGMLALGAVIEICKLIQPDNEDMLSNLQYLQKRLRYGLASPSSIALYELGFSDRVVAKDMGTKINEVLTRRDALEEIKEHEEEMREVIQKYPAYFIQIFNGLLAQ